jgi:hypothetical protein
LTLSRGILQARWYVARLKLIPIPADSAAQLRRELKERAKALAASRQIKSKL